MLQQLQMIPKTKIQAAPYNTDYNTDQDTDHNTDYNTLIKVFNKGFNLIKNKSFKHDNTPFKKTACSVLFFNY